MWKLILILMAVSTMTACGRPAGIPVDTRASVNLEAAVASPAYLDCWVVSGTDDPDAAWYTEIAATTYGCKPKE